MTPRPPAAMHRRVGAQAPRRLAVVLLLLVLAPGAARASDVPVFFLADRSDVIARGTIEAVQPYKDGELYVYTVHPSEVLKGDLAPGKPFALVQERLFKTEAPYFRQGATTLIFAVRFPLYSSYRSVLPEQPYLRWTERTNSANEVAPLTDAAFVEPLARYLALRGDVPGTARYLAGLLGHLVPRLRADALATLEARPELAAALDALALGGLGDVLAATAIPVSERAQILVRLGRAQVEALVPIAERAAATEGPLQAAAVDALVSLGRVPSEERLLAYSRSTDPALRLAAARGLARAASPAALARLRELLATDPSSEVQVATLKALGTTRADAAVPVLAASLRAADKPRIYAASEALAAIGSPAAIEALAKGLIEGPSDTSVAAAFALGRTGKIEAVTVLREQLDRHPDPQVRKAIKLALGGAPEEHE